MKLQMIKCLKNKFLSMHLWKPEVLRDQQLVTALDNKNEWN